MHKRERHEPLKKNKELVLENIINHLSTCSLYKVEKYGDVVSKVKEVNLHHHTRMCRKKLTECRFYFKKFPSQRTILA